jgi:uncharacterized protein (TIGR02246 family)
MPRAGLEGTVEAFFDAFNRGDLDAIMALYEPNATMVPQPGQAAEGLVAIRKALSRFLAMKPNLTMEKKSLVVAGDIALLIVKATLLGKGSDGAPMRMEHTSSDVLRRQVDGRWLFVIDNPWGARILDYEPRTGSR